MRKLVATARPRPRCRRRRSRPGLARQARDAARAVPARRLDRHDRAHRRRRSCRRSSAAPSSSTTRPAPAARSAPRRPSAPRPTATRSSSRRSGPFVIGPHLIKGARLRPAEGLRLHHRRRAGAQRARGAGQLAAQVARRRAEVHQGQPGQDDLRLGRQRHVATTSPPSCSGRRPAPRACTCRTRAARRRCRTCSAARSTRPS